jgi:hypothetical protein
MSNKEGWSRLLLDGDTGWHIRTGDWIRQHGAVPMQDLFSFSKPGGTWFAWEWGSDVILSLLHSAGGLKAVVIFFGALVCVCATILVRQMIWGGANGLLALGMGFLGVGASSIHYLARPHLFTLLLLPIAIWIIDRDRRENTPWLWSLVPITILWTNLHGGFMALIACLGLLVVGVAIETWWESGLHGDWRAVRRYSLLTALCSLATLVNPYGYQLHVHIAKYLSSDWIRDAVLEFQSPDFRSENLFHFELLLLAGMLAAASQLSRRKVVATLWMLFWAHEALTSVRHVTVFAMIAAPIIAVEATLLWRRVAAGAARNSVGAILDSLASDMTANFRWTSIWPAAALIVVPMIGAPIQWPKDFPSFRFPLKLIEKHETRIRAGRVLTSDQWADYLIYRFYPTQRVFFDGRSDFYGPVLGKQYMRMSSGQHDWQQILASHEFDMAILPVEWSLGSLLKADADWRLLDDDGKALVFERVGGKSIRASAQTKKANVLMKTPPASEFEEGEPAQ